MEDPAAAIPAEAFDVCRRDAVKGLAALNSHLSAQRARLTAATLTDIEALQRLMAVGGGIIAVLVLALAGTAVWFTRSRIVGPLGRLVEDARRLARRDLDRPFQGWGRRREAGFRRDELGLLGSDPRQELLLRGIVELAHRIGLEVVAEGVETEEERAVLTRIGCDYAQGYLFARPLSVADAEALLLAAGRP